MTISGFDYNSEHRGRYDEPACVLPPTTGKRWPFTASCAITDPSILHNVIVCRTPGTDDPWNRSVASIRHLVDFAEPSEFNFEALITSTCTTAHIGGNSLDVIEPGWSKTPSFYPRFLKNLD